MAYSQVSDMLVGDVATVDDSSKQKHVSKASDEIDERLGFKYSTPFTEQTVSHPAWLLIGRLANFIASGRFLLEIDQSGEENSPHAYGLYLLKEADAIIASILNGTIDLDPPGTSDGSPEPSAPRGLLTGNVDPYSQVEGFYGWAAGPHPRYSVYGPMLMVPFYR